MNMHPDLAIVGAGPIGLATARAAADAGAEVLVIDRKPERGDPSCCTGLVSPRTLPTLGASTSCVLRDIRALRIHLPNQRIIDLQSDRIKAVVIDRKKLERELVALVRSVGVEVQHCVVATDAHEGMLSAQSGTEALRIRPTLIIGADGPRSRIAAWFGLAQPAQFAAAAQVELEGSPTRPDGVDIYMGHGVAPGFFAWSVPAEEGILRVGLAVLPPHAPDEFLRRLLSKHYPSAPIRSHAEGLIPLAPAPVPATAGVLLVGDAAGQTKPLSGGGLYTGGACAQIAGTLAAHVASGKISFHWEEAYGRSCRDVIGKEQAFGRSIREHLSGVTDADMAAIAAALDDPQLLQFLADEADIDSFHRLPDRLAAEPRLWSTLLRLIPLIGSRAGAQPSA